MFVLQKFLLALLLPPASGILLLGAAALVWKHRRRVSLLMAATGLVALWLPSLPPVAYALAARLEAIHPPPDFDQLPVADAIVVLGGAVRFRSDGRVEMSEAADRVLDAARLYHLGKAPWIVASGGSPGADGWPGSEAAAMKTFLGELGVPASAVLLEDRSRNTRENAEMTRSLLDRHGLREVHLVTSAIHMPRALRRFQQAGVSARPVATDALAGSSARWPWSLLVPDAEAMRTSALALKEMVAGLAARLAEQKP